MCIYISLSHAIPSYPHKMFVSLQNSPTVPAMGQSFALPRNMPTKDSRRSSAHRRLGHHDKPLLTIRNTISGWWLIVVNSG